jgi:hypothetical protein
MRGFVDILAKVSRTQLLFTIPITRGSLRPHVLLLTWKPRDTYRLHCIQPSSKYNLFTSTNQPVEISDGCLCYDRDEAVVYRMLVSCSRTLTDPVVHLAFGLHMRGSKG